MAKDSSKGPLGANLKHLRELKGKSVPDVARDLGLEVMTLTQLESRNSKLSKFAPELAGYFGIELEVFLTKDLTQLTPQQILSLNVESKEQKAKQVDPKSTANANRDLINGQAVQKLFSQFLEATDEGRQSILDAADLAPKFRR